MKIKLRPTDTQFSNYIRERDDWTCQRCRKKYDKYSTEDRQGLHCSHYWGRGREGTRFEPDNCIALCYGCHRLWGHGDQRDQYKDFMIKKLGERRFKTLEIQANTYKRRDDKMDKIIIKALQDDWEKQNRKGTPKNF